jgi:hypothetical protein
MSQVHEQALPAGTRLDSFELRDVLGVGGFGITYRAYDHQLACEVAIKEYFPCGLVQRSGDGTTITTRSGDDRDGFDYGLSRFLDEARTLARFREPAVVRVSRYLEANGTAYLVMDLERGESLAARIQREGSLVGEFARALLPPVLGGLSAVHEAGILHRDIKPANLMIRHEGSPVLLDFGAARQAVEERTQALTAVLTPGYAPIEQYGEGDRQGPWTDLYSLGATLYHGITSRPPAPSTDRITALAEGEPDPVVAGLQQVRDRYGATLLKIVYWLMRPHAKDRPRGARQVLEVLARLDAQEASGRAGGPGAEARAAGRAAPRAGPAAGGPTLVGGAGSLRIPTQSRGGAEGGFPAPGGRSATASGPPSRDDAPTRFSETRVAAAAERSGGGASRTALSPAFLGRVEEALADYLGPIAGLLVEQAARDCPTRAVLLERLAVEIDVPAERGALLAALRKLAG